MATKEAAAPLQAAQNVEPVLSPPAVTVAVGGDAAAGAVGAGLDDWEYILDIDGTLEVPKTREQIEAE